MERLTIQPEVSPQMKAFQAYLEDPQEFGRLTNYAASICHQLSLRNTDAEDILQESLRLAIRSIDHFRGDSKYHTWLHAIMKNVGHNFRRTLNREKARVAFDPTILEDQAVARKEIGQIPEDLAEYVRKSIDNAFSSLPEEQARALSLQCFDGLNYEQVAASMNMSINQVRGLIFRARREMKVLLGETMNILAA